MQFAAMDFQCMVKNHFNIKSLLIEAHCIHSIEFYQLFLWRAKWDVCGIVKWISYYEYLNSRQMDLVAENFLFSIFPRSMCHGKNWFAKSTY